MRKVIPDLNLKHSQLPINGILKRKISSENCLARVCGGDGRMSGSIMEGIPLDDGGALAGDWAVAGVTTKDTHYPL